MQRARMLRELGRASTPDQIAEALWTARAWLISHPDDDELRDAMERLLARERTLVRA
jgi:hypothetical protein